MNAPLSVRQFALGFAAHGFNPIAISQQLGQLGPDPLVGEHLIPVELSPTLARLRDGTATRDDISCLHDYFTLPPEVRDSDSTRARLATYLTQTPPRLVENEDTTSPELGAHDSTFLPKAGSVVGTAVNMLVHNANQEAHMDMPTNPQQRAHHAAEKIQRSAFADLPNPKSIDEAQKTAQENRAQEFQETKDYRNAQLDRMTATERAAYQDLEKTTADIYTREQDTIGKRFFEEMQSLGGMPATEALSKADLKLQAAISGNSYLKSKRIRPLEFQILHLRHQAFINENTPEKRVIERNALAMESRYVVETLTAKVTEMIKAGKPESEFEPYESLAAEAAAVYLRLIDGSQIESTDYERLQVYRDYVFNFHIDWSHEALAPIYDAMKEVQEAQEAHIASSHKFMLEMAHPSTDLIEGSERLSMERERADFEFQKIRMQEQMKRLNDVIKERASQDPEYVKKMTGELSLSGEGELIAAKIAERYAADFAAAMDEYEKQHKAYIKKWQEFLSGDDVKTREHGRNAADKDTCYALLMKCQIALEWLYFHYDARKNPADAQSERLRPSCLSVTYVTQSRNMDKAFEGTLHGKEITNQAMEGFFRAAWELSDDILANFGFKIPLLGWNVFKGRNPVDNNYIDRLALIAGGFYAGDEVSAVAGTIFAGFKNNARLLQQVQTHPDIANIAGAAEVFDGQDLTELSPMHHLALQTLNHNGSMEFMLVLQTLIAGIHTPQFAQGGAAEAPVFKEYLRNRCLVGERDDGGTKATKNIINFYLRHPALDLYGSGTRGVTASGGDLGWDYAHHPEGILMRRIVTDRATSGMVTKIVNALTAEAGADSQDLQRLKPSLYFMNMMVAIMAHGGLGLGEPTWFLGNDKVKGVMNNLSPKNMFNFANLDLPQMIGIGGMFSSLGFPSQKELQAQSPELFVHASGVPYSERECYIRYLQVMSHVMSAMQRYTAMCMQMVKPPEPTEEQKKDLAKAEKMTPDQQKEDTEEKMSQWARERLGRTIADRAPPSTLLGKDRTKKPVEPITSQEQERLNAAFAREEAMKLAAPLTAVPTKHRIKIDALDVKKWEVEDKAKHKKAVEILTEAIQRGFSYAQKLGPEEEVAFDGDSVLWDHFFIAEMERLPKLAQDELIDFLMGAHGEGADINEVINVNPLWVAFMIGYRKAKGHGPVLFSSTIIDRLKSMTAFVGKNPVITALFETLLNEDHLTAERALERITQEESPEKSQDDTKIITRARIARYVDTMMDRYMSHGCNLDATNDSGQPVFSDIEKVDIKAMLKTGGDVHLKYRGIFAYRVLIDDRRENVEHANSYNETNGKNEDQVDVFQPETFTDNPFVQYIATLPAHADWRKLQALTGDPIRIMRALDDSQKKRPGRGLTHFSRKTRSEKTAVMYRPENITFTRAQTRANYVEPAHRARTKTTKALAMLMALAERQRTEHVNAMEALVAIYEKQKATSTLPPVRFQNALERLRTNLSIHAKDHKPFKEPADFELLDWLTEPNRMPDDNMRTEAKRHIATLRDRKYITSFSEALPPVKKSSGMKDISRYVAEAQKIAGKALKKAGQFFELGQAVAKAHLEPPLNEELQLTSMASIRKWINSPREQILLFRLGQFFKNPKANKLPPEDVVKGVGIIIERIGFRVAKNILDQACSDPRINYKIQEKLKQNREQIDRELKVAIPDFADAIKALHRFVVAYKETKPAFDRLAESGAKLTGRDEIRGLAWAFTKRTLGETYDAAVERQKALNPDDNSKITEQAVTVIADNILASGMEVFGEDSTVGIMCRKLRWDLVEQGLEQTIRNAVAIYEDFTNLNSNGDVRDTVNALLQNKGDTAEAILRNRASTLLKTHKDTKKAAEVFENIYRAAWLQVIHGNPELDAQRQADLTEMAKRISTEVFRSAKAKSQNPVEAAA